MNGEQSVLLIMTDEHRPDAMGAAGHPVVETPMLDSLAENGVRFSNGYCPSPICAPSRASFATGRYVHEHQVWDNATSYDGTPESWGRYLDDRDVSVTTIGKLDFTPDGNDGFDDQRLATHREPPDPSNLHVRRDPPPVRGGARERIRSAGPVDDEPWYAEQEEQRTREAVRFLEERARSDDDSPWVLWLNYLIPHFPLEVERSYYERYPLEEVGRPVDYPAADDHPILNEFRDHYDGRGLDDRSLREARAAYFGLCTVVDKYIGRVIEALERTGQAADTLVVYTSDHGELLGDHELWWKGTMHEPSVGIPLILRGPGIDGGQTVDQPVTLLDLLPTIADAVGVDPDSTWRGQSLLPLAEGTVDENPDRPVFSEYHATGTSRGVFMLRQGSFKYVYYPGNPDQLFDLEADPNEVDNLADDPEYEDVRSRLASMLQDIVDPDSVDRMARSDQRRRLREIIDDDTNEEL